MGGCLIRRRSVAVLGAGVVTVFALCLTSPAAGQIDLPPLPLPPLPPLPTLLPGPPPAPASPAQQPPAPASQAPPAPVPQRAAPPKASGPAPQLPRCGNGSVRPGGRRSPPGNTSDLVAKGRPLFDIGLPQDKVLEFLAPPFPVAGPAKFSDDWGNPRYTPCFHLHEGTDIFAPRGTPVVAPGPGVIVGMGDHPVGGLAVWLQTDDRNSFFMCHFDRFPEGLAPGQRVDRSTVVGYVGNTGNAEGGATHLHFEIHPPLRGKGGEIVAWGIDPSPGGLGQTRTPAVNPKPYLDQWLAEAMRTAEPLVTAVIKRGGVLPNDPNALADFARAQFILASDQSMGLFGLGKTANRGILFVAVALGLLALMQSLGTLARGSRGRRKPASTVLDTRVQSLYSARLSASVAARQQQDDIAQLHRRRFGKTRD